MVHLIADRAGTTALTGSLDRIDAEALAATVEHATVREVDPGRITVEQGRFPSTKLAEFIRCRDLTCRFPGCDVPAWDTDIDHTVAWPAGPTHPSNLKCLCRTHHLLKTFFDDWNDVQLANGTVVWTSPTGHVYTTEPEGAQWFAGLGDPTGEPTLQAIVPTLATRCMKMPTRERPRHEDTRRRITAERHTNRARLEQQEQGHQAWLAAHDVPAPF